MTSLYNCRHSGDQYRITKFTSDMDVESSYLCTTAECECPAGHRPTCRHREMLPKFIAREHIGDEWFYDYSRGGWVQGAAILDQLAGAARELEEAIAETNSCLNGTTTLPAELETILEGTKPSSQSAPADRAAPYEPASLPTSNVASAGAGTIRRRV